MQPQYQMMKTHPAMKYTSTHFCRIIFHDQRTRRPPERLNYYVPGQACNIQSNPVYSIPYILRPIFFNDLNTVGPFFISPRHNALHVPVFQRLSFCWRKMNNFVAPTSIVS